MKFFERNLLKKLQSDNVTDAPLDNIRKAMGSIGYAVGNPLSKTEIFLQITVAYFDENLGVPIPPVALPVALQTSLPVYVFGLTDFCGGFFRSNSLLPFNIGWGWGNALGQSNMGVIGRDRGDAFFRRADGINGDLYLTYFGGILPNAFAAEIFIHCNNVAYGTFLNSFASDLITIDMIRYFVPFIANINQFINPIVLGYQTLFGKVSSDSIDPRVYITNREPQQWIADIPINLPIDKNLLCGFYLDVFCPGVGWTLFVKKVEPLTHKN